MNQVNLKDEHTKAALAALELDGIEFSEQEREILRELDDLNYSDEQIRLFLKAGRRTEDSP